MLFRSLSALTLAILLAPALTCAQPTPTQPKPAPKPPEKNADGKTVITGPKGKQVAYPLEIYDEQADGETQIREAVVRAKTDNRRILIMWGENYCGFCSELHDLLDWEDPRLRTLVDTEFEVVMINLGKPQPGVGFSNTKHVQLANTYSPATLAGGTPSLSILDPLNGNKLVATLDGKAALAKPMTMQRVYDSQVLYNFLTEHRPAPKVAMTLLSEHLVFAGRVGKKLLIWFGEPESPASAELHRWFNNPDVARTLDPAYMVLKIDPQRMTTGRIVMDRLTGKPGAPCPFIAIVNSQGQPIDAGALLNGYPATTEQRAALRAALLNNTDKISADSLDAAIAKLPEKPTEPAPKGPAPR